MVSIEVSQCPDKDISDHTYTTTLASGMSSLAVTVTHPLRNVPGIQLRHVTRRHSVDHAGDTHSKGSTTLVVFFGWLGAKPRGLQNYFNMYEEQCLDVLFIPGNVVHFVWPPSVKNFTNYLLTYLCQSEDITKYKHILIHGISIGAYVFVCCQMTAQENETLFSPFIEKIAGIILDSPTYGSFERMRKGVARGLVKSKVFQALIPNLLSVYFFLTWQYTVEYFEKAMHFLEDNPLPVPYVFFLSKDDPMCDSEVITSVASKWRTKISYPVLTKSWEKSVHAAHLKYHQREYMDTFNKFMTTYSSSPVQSKL